MAKDGSTNTQTHTDLWAHSTKDQKNGELDLYCDHSRLKGSQMLLCVGKES